jgi:transposase
LVFGVSVGYVEKIFRQRKASGQQERVRYKPGPKSRLTPEVTARIAALLESRPDLTIAELRERLALDIGVKMSWSTVRLWVRQLGLRLKKSRSTPSSGTRKPTANAAKSSWGCKPKPAEFIEGQFAAWYSGFPAWLDAVY